MALSERDLLAIIRQHRANSLGTEDSDLSSERAAAMDHYHGRPYGNEVEGRSQVVSRDLAETVDWAMPGIMRVFVASGNIAEFDPVGPEDEQAAQQESDYVNQVLMRDNPGFMVLHDAIKDTLLLKNGYVKHWWDEETKTSEESYQGLTLDQLTMLWRDLESKGSEVEIAAQSSRMIEIPGMPPQNQAQQIMTPPGIEVFDVKLRITRKVGRLVWMAVPTEEVRVSKKCRGSLQESPFTEHVTKKTRSDLIEMGMPAEFVHSLPAYNETPQSEETLARDSTDNESDGADPVNDKSMDEIEYCEAFVRVDYDGDGVAELRKIITAGDKIPPGDEWNEPIEAVPMTSFIAKRVPHRHVGESLDDELADLQEIMTVLRRQMLDNLYLTNNSEIVINELANTRDFLTRIPGGVKRVKGEGAVQSAVMPLQVASMLNQILPAIDHFRLVKETRTGVRPGSDMDPDILKGSTKGAFMEHVNRANQKIEMMARLIAETGVKEAVLQCHAILMRHQDMARQVQLRGKWVPVNPQEWRERTDLTVKVGLGTGNNEEKRTHLMMLTQLQGQLMQALMQAPPPVYAKMYAMFDDMAGTLGVETPEKYAVAPGSQEHQQLMQFMQQQKQQGDPRMAIEAQKAQQMVMLKDRELQQQGALEQQRMTMQAKVDQNRQEMEAQQQQAKMNAEMQLRQMETMLDMREKRMEAMMEMQFRKWLAQLEAATKIETANIASETNAESAATMAATGEIAAEVTQGPQPMGGGMMGNAPEEGGGMME